MNTVVLIVSSLLAVAQTASVVPIESSSVNVKQSGQDYSYTIQENRGIAVDPSGAIRQQMPIVKSAQLPTSAGSILLNQLDQKGIQQSQEQVQGQIPQTLDIQTQNARPQELLKSVNLITPTTDTFIVPTNIQYGLPYPYGLHYPVNIIRIV